MQSEGKMIDHEDLKRQVTEFKAKLETSPQNLKQGLKKAQGLLQKDIDMANQSVAKGGGFIPEIDYQKIENNQVSQSDIEKIRQAGCLVIRNQFAQSLAKGWNEQLIAYIEENDYIGLMPSRQGMDSYFSTLGSSRPQIYAIYWSRPQMEVRHHPHMLKAKQFLNKLWDMDGKAEFNPLQDYTYADRARRRRPGDKSLGLSPHMDAGSIERWLDRAYHKIYGTIFEGSPEKYNPWLANHRTSTHEIPSPAVCSMFRSFQGWTALTQQGKGDGTLMVVPSLHAITYMLLRALQDDVAPNDLCGAMAGKALAAKPEWHGDILNGIGSIPTVNPGDTVWWHPDIIHAVEDNHTGKLEANVIYVGASPACDKNLEYAHRQFQKFLKGESPPDFAPENYEVEFKNRADLSQLDSNSLKMMNPSY